MNYPWYEYQRWHGTLLIIAVLLFSVIFNTIFAQQLHLVEGSVLFIHIFGFLGILITLWVTSDRASSSEVWTTFSDPGWDNQGLSALIGIVASVAPLLGADAAGTVSMLFDRALPLTSIAHMAEELQDAAFTLPRTMVWATFINGGMMFVMCITICYCIGDLDEGKRDGYAVGQLMLTCIGSTRYTNGLPIHPDLLQFNQVSCCSQHHDRDRHHSVRLQLRHCYGRLVSPTFRIRS